MFHVWLHGFQLNVLASLPVNEKHTSGLTQSSTTLDSQLDLGRSMYNLYPSSIR